MAHHPNPWMDEARAHLARAVSGIELDEAEQRILRWLDGWDADTLHPIASIIEKARRAFPLDPQS